MVGREASVAHLGRHPTVTVPALVLLINGLYRVSLQGVFLFLGQGFLVVIEYGTSHLS